MPKLQNVFPVKINSVNTLYDLSHDFTRMKPNIIIL